MAKRDDGDAERKREKERFFRRLKLLKNPLRKKILTILDEGNATPEEIYAQVGHRSAAEYHLRVLHTCGLVET